MNTRLIALGVALAAASSPSGAAVITVNTNADYGNIADSNCNLFEAVQAANSNAAGFGCVAGEPAPSVDTIAFSVPGGGVATITQSVQLVITESVIIDGYTQPGAAPNTNTPAEGGLDSVLRVALVSASGGSNATAQLDPGETVTLRGLALRNGNVALFASGGTLAIEGCYVGTDASGLIAGTGLTGVRLSGQAALRIGGSTAAARNLFAGLGSSAIDSFIGSPDTVIEGNLIGTNRSGLVALPIGGVAIDFRVAAGADNIRIGGTGVGQRNVIGGAALQAIRINALGNDSATDLVGDGVVVQGNLIGVGVDGLTPIPNVTLDPAPFGNTRSAVRYASLANSTGRARIGGLGAGEGNLIAFNGGAGVELSGNGVLAEVAGNVIVGNETVALDLGQNGPDGVTANDPADADTGGANRYQNFPLLTRYLFVPGTGNAGTVEVDFGVDSATANSVYPLRVDFYEPVGNQPLRLLASVSINAASAQQPQSTSFAVAANPRLLIATATDAAGRTSEFSQPFPIEILRDGFEDAP
jgi:hypothetical protein